MKLGWIRWPKNATQTNKSKKETTHSGFYARASLEEPKPRLYYDDSLLKNPNRDSHYDSSWKLPIAENGNYSLLSTERLAKPTQNCNNVEDRTNWLRERKKRREKKRNIECSNKRGRSRNQRGN